MDEQSRSEFHAETIRGIPAKDATEAAISRLADEMQRGAADVYADNTREIKYTAEDILTVERALGEGFYGAITGEFTWRVAQM